ncbi:SDR family oxidoreductase [Wenzhouxiangella marina]|uniref:Short-chain dehydrogenase n=1 Tax=Wenzhouxiangella marina TaxID=1579979 RepID=A0A0K0XW51_9GAMM|nr:SDR family oxidoreductase [Wenzhouxiangella marina]AKS41908.1 short-chain dehydrogenase [Wenzhouxiangella marina]MBB6086325.1 NAD(P)-dependent dehydrogenase (short-subunit alcohol dehydrogenase family) [Wenzhouxiangella marina]
MATAVITGANRGIGLELARQLSGDFDIIGICRRSSEELDALGVRVEAGIDITQGQDLQRMAARLAGVSIDLLINNAGLLRPSSLAGIEDELDDWRAQFEVNALAPIRVTSALREQLAEGGKVVIITSRMGSIADNDSGGAYAYRMSKSAVNSAGVSLAHELKGRSIAVGLLHPGYVRTGMTGHTGHIDPDQAAAQLIERIHELDMRLTGSFRHANGESLPW